MRGGWLVNQPYVLLCITAICWAGNAIVGRLAAGHIPPVTLAFLRWFLAFLIILPFAWKHLKRDWSAIRARLGTMILISFTGISVFTTLQYWALEHTQALNTLLLQSAGPLFVAAWSLVLLGVRLTLAQAIGVLVSLTGVLVILLHGDLTAIDQHRLQQGRRDLHRGAGDLRALLGADAEAARHSRPVVCRLHLRMRRGVPDPASDLRNCWRARPMQLNASNLLSLIYVAVFPSALAYLCFNRGVQLIGANRAAPFFHVVPAFGSVMAMVFLGERPQLSTSSALRWC